MNFSKTQKTLYLMILIAMFSALCFVGTYVSIPIGVSKIHLGNFFCIIAGLLCGGFVGGISGALGMGLNDLLNPMGYGVDTILRTVIVKFLVGFIVGELFRYLIKKEKKIKSLFFVLVLFSSIVFIFLLILYFIFGKEILISGKIFPNSLFLIILVGVMSIFYLIIFIFSTRIEKVQQYVLASSTIACSCNILLEFILKIPFKMLIVNMSFEGACIYALTSLPSSLLTAIITTIFVSIIFLPTYYATRRYNKLDNLYNYIVKITTFENKKTNKF